MNKNFSFTGDICVKMTSNGCKIEIYRESENIKTKKKNVY